MSTLAEERYGRRAGGPARRRRLVVAAALVLVVALVWIFWVSVLRQPKLQWETVGYDVRSDARIVVTFDVFFRGGADTAVCTVLAQNELHTDVGLKDVTVRPGPRGRVRAVVALPTSERATTGLVNDCVVR